MSISETIPSSSAIVALPRRAPPETIGFTFPKVTAGQLWLIETPDLAVGDRVLARHVVEGANVVVYDRSLGPHLAQAFPLGTYAEPAPETVAAGDPAAPRCVRFARDGWSVARLSSARLPRRERLARLRDTAAELNAAGVPGSLPVTVLAETVEGISECGETTLDRLADTVVTYNRDTHLAIVIDAYVGSAAASAVVANGLAG